jgi:hypothetical protein
MSVWTETGISPREMIFSNADCEFASLTLYIKVIRKMMPKLTSRLDYYLTKLACTQLIS